MRLWAVSLLDTAVALLMRAPSSAFRRRCLPPTPQPKCLYSLLPASAWGAPPLPHALVPHRSLASRTRSSAAATTTPTTTAHPDTASEQAPATSSASSSKTRTRKKAAATQSRDELQATQHAAPDRSPSPDARQATQTLPTAGATSVAGVAYLNSNGGQVTRMVVIGVDPDSHGAVAVASWDTTDISQQVELSQVQLEVYDMPVVEVPLQKKSKTTGKHMKRRWLDLEVARRLINTVKHKNTPPSPPPQPTTPTHSQSSNGVRNADSNGHSPQAPRNDTVFKAVLLNGTPQGMELRAFLESTPTLPSTSSARSIATQLHAVGGWGGLLSMANFKTSTVPATVWKKDLSLFGLDKTGSLALARQLWPNHTSMLSRQKDHGRAEAMLIVAWALGASRTPPLDVPLSASTQHVKLPSDQHAQIAALRQMLLVRAGLTATPPAAAPGSNGAAAEPATAAPAASKPAEQTDTADMLARLPTLAALAPGSNGTSRRQKTPRSARATPAAPAAASVSSIDTTNDSLDGTSDTESDDMDMDSDTEGLLGLLEGDLGDGEEGEKPLTPEEQAELRRLHKEHMAALVEERSRWPVKMGGLRPARATDGYGNPLPTRAPFAILPVPSGPPRGVSPSRRRSYSTSRSPSPHTTTSQPTLSDTHRLLDSEDAIVSGITVAEHSGGLLTITVTYTDTSPRRGRGRPRKADAADAPAEAPAGASRGRGRPRKAHAPNAATQLPAPPSTGTEESVTAEQGAALQDGDTLPLPMAEGPTPHRGKSRVTEAAQISHDSDTAKQPDALAGDSGAPAGDAALRRGRKKGRAGDAYAADAEPADPGAVPERGDAIAETPTDLAAVGGAHDSAAEAASTAEQQHGELQPQGVGEGRVRVELTINGRSRDFGRYPRERGALYRPMVRAFLGLSLPDPGPTREELLAMAQDTAQCSFVADMQDTWAQRRDRGKLDQCAIHEYLRPALIEAGLWSGDGSSTPNAAVEDTGQPACEGARQSDVPLDVPNSQFRSPLRLIRIPHEGRRVTFGTYPVEESKEYEQIMRALLGHVPPGLDTEDLIAKARDTASCNFVSDIQAKCAELCRLRGAHNRAGKECAIYTFLRPAMEQAGLWGDESA